MQKLEAHRSEILYWKGFSPNPRGTGWMWIHAGNLWQHFWELEQTGGAFSDISKEFPQTHPPPSHCSNVFWVSVPMDLGNSAGTARVHRGIINGNLGYFLPKENQDVPTGGCRWERKTKGCSSCFLELIYPSEQREGSTDKDKRTIPSQPRLLTSGLLFPELFRLEWVHLSPEPELSKKPGNKRFLILLEAPLSLNLFIIGCELVM